MKSSQLTRIALLRLNTAQTAIV